MKQSKENKFPIGYERFHKKQLFNFQLNRPYSFGFARYEDMIDAGESIKNFKSWKAVMLKLAENAFNDGRIMNAAFYYRAAEFYTKSNSPEKDILYNKFIELFYKAFKKDETEKHLIPYEEGKLPAIRIPSATKRKGTIVLHGGFDSFIEEFYSMMKYFSNHGYEVIGFEGPGQGAARRKFGLPITYEWEKPTKTILDYFQIDNVILYGISMGGWLCLRAAAFEPRIKRVIASGHAIDYMQSMHPLLRKLHFWCLEHCRNFMNRMAVMKFEKREGMASWMVDHLKYITKQTQPLDALDFYLQLNEQNIHSELVKQDVLILSGSKDHLIPGKMHSIQIKALTNANSVTGRIFTEKEHAQNHCQTGNIGLSLDFIIDWIEKNKNDSKKYK
jgi:alpha-beta hydrolase superfamily lysophospholipase